MQPPLGAVSAIYINAVLTWMTYISAAFAWKTYISAYN